MSARILISESTGFSRTALSKLQSVGEVIAADLDRPGLLSSIDGVDVLWVRLRHRIDAEVLAAAGSLRILASPTTGLDHLDLVGAARRNIKVISLRDAGDFLKNVPATAELTLGLMLSLMRHIPSAVEDVAAGHWERDRFKGHEIRGKTVGIVGYGRLGRLVGAYLRAFGATIVAADPYVSTSEAGIEMVSLPALLRVADVVTLHVTLSETTRALIDSEALALMKPGALLINTSRGEVIDSEALIRALQSKHLGGAALDVVAEESAQGVGSLPLVVYAREHNDLIITPHIGGCTFESMESTEVFVAERVCEALRVTS